MKDEDVKLVLVLDQVRAGDLCLYLSNALAKKSFRTREEERMLRYSIKRLEAGMEKMAESK